MSLYYRPRYNYALRNRRRFIARASVTAAASSTALPYAIPKALGAEFVAGPRRKPTGYLTLDKSHPAAPDRYAFLFDQIHSVNLAVPSEFAEAKVGSGSLPALAVTHGNRGIDFANSVNQTNGQYLNLPVIGPIGSGYALIEFSLDAVTAGNQFLLAHTDTPANKRLYIYINSGVLVAAFGLDTVKLTTTTSLNANQRYVTCVTWRSDGVCDLYLDGELIDAGTFNATYLPGSTSQNTTVGSWGVLPPYNGLNGQIAAILVGKQYLGAPMAKSLSADPYQLLKPAADAVVYTVTAGGNTVTPAPDSLVITGNAPTVSVTDNQTVVPAQDSLTLTGQAPTVVVSDNQIVEPAQDALIVTGQVPTVAATDNQVVEPAAETLTVTGYAPTVVTVVQYAMLPVPKALHPDFVNPQVAPIRENVKLAESFGFDPRTDIGVVAGNLYPKTSPYLDLREGWALTANLPLGVDANFGRCADYDGTQVRFATGAPGLSGTELTFFITVRPRVIAEDWLWFQTVGAFDHADGIIVKIQPTGTHSSNSDCFSVNIDGAVCETVAGSAVAGKVHQLVVVWRGGTDIEVWNNGALIGSGFDSGTPTALASGTGFFHGGNFTGNTFDGLIGTAITLQRAMSSGEAKQFSIAPYREIYEPKVPQHLFSIATPPSNVIVEPTSDALTITGLAPTVVNNVAVEPANDSLTITGLAPTVVATANIVLEPANDTLIINGFEPSVVSDNVVEPANDTLVITGLVPVVQVRNILEPGNDTLTITGYPPVVVLPIVVAPANDTLIFTGFGPKVTTLTLPTPTERTYTVDAEGRICIIDSENRTFVA